MEHVSNVYLLDAKSEGKLRELFEVNLVQHQIINLNEHTHLMKSWNEVDYKTLIV